MKLSKRAVAATDSKVELQLLRVCLQLATKALHRYAEERDALRAEIARLRDLLASLPEFAEEHLYDGDHDQPLAGYRELHDIAALRVPTAVTE